MSGNIFQFKHFAVKQDECAMKVGTDGVLLGAWCRIEPADKATLDIGTGTGVITLMLAQRTESLTASIDNGEFTAVIEAVEIDGTSAAQACWNFEVSRWRNRIKLHAISAQKFADTQPARFDHIVSNPPYFTGSLASPDSSRNTARHADSLSHEELMHVCDKLLKPDGRVSLILPAGPELQKMITAAGAHGFAVSRLTEVHSTPRSGVKRILVEFLRHRNASRNADIIPKITSLTIGDVGSGTFSAEYRALTRDFYLRF